MNHVETKQSRGNEMHEGNTKIREAPNPYLKNKFLLLKLNFFLYKKN